MQVDDYHIGFLAVNQGQRVGGLCGLPDLVTPVIEKGRQGLRVFRTGLQDDHTRGHPPGFMPCGGCGVRICGTGSPPIKAAADGIDGGGGPGACCGWLIPIRAA